MMEDGTEEPLSDDDLNELFNVTDMDSVDKVNKEQLDLNVTGALTIMVS